MAMAIKLLCKSMFKRFNKKKNMENNLNEENKAAFTEENITKENNSENTNSDNPENLSINTDEHQKNENEPSNNDSQEEFRIKFLEMNDKYLRLYSEFENFRRRTSKERLELINTAGEEIIKAVLPVVDDFERALKSIDNTEDKAAIKEGIDLIYNKLYHILNSKGLEPMNSMHEQFNADLHEAITQIPAEKEEWKGKVVDEIEKGYLLKGKVIRYAKVVVGN